MAQIITPKIGEYWVLVTPVKVFRDFKDGTFDVCDEDGNCLKTLRENLTNKTINNMKAMKDAVLKVAQTLAKANNTVTTLEIKTELRRDYPYFFWDQATVSNYMDQLAGDGIFKYTDNGTYRIYALTKTLFSTRRPVASGAVSLKGLTKTVKVSPANTVSLPTGNITVYNRKIDSHKLLQYAVDSKFVAVTLSNGTTVSKNTIKAQKKSPLGYITPKVGRIKSIVVGTTQYNVK